MTAARGNSNRQEIDGLDRTIRPKWPTPIKFGVPDPDNAKAIPEAYYPELEWCEIVVQDGRETQARDFDSGQPQFWPSGDPLMVLVLLGTTARDGLECSLFIQGKQMVDAFAKARGEAGVSGIAEGDTVRMRWNGTQPTVAKKGSRAKLSPTMLYECELIPV
jgi:hypothetical protein